MIQLPKKRKRKQYIKVLREATDRILSHFRYVNRRLRQQAVILQLKKADIILAKPGFFNLSPIALLYRLLLKSEYVHSMLYIGNGKIIHTTTRNGVIIHKVPGKIYKRNRYSIYRAKNLVAAQRNQIVNEALQFRHMKLDLMGLIVNVPKNMLGIKKSLLKLERNRLWCSKLVYQAYSAAGIYLVPETESNIITSERLSKSKVLDRVK